MQKTNEIGKPLNRIDGQLKVTGTAKYAAEFNQPGMAYAFPVRSTIAKGTITAFDTSAAEQSGGVTAVLTHQNAPRLKAVNPPEMMKVGGALMGEQLVPLQDNKVYYFGQFIAVVVAETYEQARHAASLVKLTYAKEAHAIDLEAELPKAPRPKLLQGQPAQLNEGAAAAPLAAAPVRFEQTYTTSTENHHPMEPHATVAVWEGTDKLTLYDGNQGIMNTRGVMAYFFGLKPENVRVLCPFLGGGFGGKVPWTHNLLATMAAQAVKRPVKLVVTRQMMQTSVGRRSATIQKIALGAVRDGKLTVIRQHCDSYHNNLTQFFEPSGKQTRILYGAPMREITYRVAKLDTGTPTFMRSPGEATGSFALESAVDEMAYTMKIDPVEFRVLNHTGIDPLKKLPFSSKYLRECYRTGAEKFGWSQRKMEPRQNRSGKLLIGYGMATATYGAYRAPATARVRMMANGEVKVTSATIDMGTGTYTILAQTAADALGVPMRRISVEIGDSIFPPAPVSGRSQTTASVGPAVLAASEALIKDLMELALADKKSKLRGRRAEEIGFANAGFFVKGNTSTSDSYADIMRRNSKTMMEACTEAIPAGSEPSVPSGPNAPVPLSGACTLASNALEENWDEKKYSFQSFGAQFAEVWVDEDFGTIRVKRFVSVHDVGRIMNEKTARSQIIGGVIYALGQALMEETAYDNRWANPVTRSLADYHVPVNLDVPVIDVHFIGKPDPHISPIGARGAGEIGGVGVAAAVANAVFNATGKRLRDLPLTPDKFI